MPISMEQVAKLAGTSRATVSYVLRDQWRERGITEGTRKRVREVADRLQYRPNLLAQGLVSGKTMVLGVQLPSFLYEHWSSILRRVEESARARGYRLLLSMPAYWCLDEENEIETLVSQRVDGLILAPRRARRMESLYQRLVKQKVPFVFMGNSAGRGYYSVVDDNVGQAEMATRHLIGLGHTRIAHLFGSRQSRASLERYDGYRRAMRAAGLPLKKQWVGEGGFAVESGLQAGEKLLSLVDRPTAVYASGDAMALGIVAAAERRGLRVPNDLAIVGHADDVPFHEFHRTPLTTIRQPREALAEQAVAMLVGLINQQKPKLAVVKLPGELIVRASCGGDSVTE